MQTKANEIDAEAHKRPAFSLKQRQIPSPTEDGINLSVIKMPVLVKKNLSST